VSGLALMGVYLALLYNGLVSVRNRMERAWSLIDVQLKRRHELVPRPAEIVRGYAAHEAAVQEKLAAMRTGEGGGRRVPSGEEASGQAAAANGQTRALSGLFAVVERYPQLEADAQFRQLAESITDTEDRIALARGFFNDSVNAYNDRIGTLPDLLFAKLFGFGAAPHFEIEAFEKQPVRVSG